MSSWRLRLLQISTLSLFGLISLRLAYWQLLSGPRLESLAFAQRSSQIEIPSSRGLITSVDGFPLVSNQPSFLAYYYLPDLVPPATKVADLITPILFDDNPDNATYSGKSRDEALRNYHQATLNKLTSASSWVALDRSISEKAKTALTGLALKGLGFEANEIRSYPEASMAAQLLGFVGSDAVGKPKGYFGLEGYYNLELSGTPGLLRQELDLHGQPILTGVFSRVDAQAGRSIKTHLDRSLQFIVETALADGLARYQASAGEVVIMDPFTGAIVAMASLPSYNPGEYRKVDPVLYRNPSIADTYEPGSTFKVIIMAAALNEKVVTPETQCDHTCDGPVTIGTYSIKTWNNVYHPGINMTSVLEQSDNTGMVYVMHQMDKNRYLKSIQDFGFGEPTGIDLQGEEASPLRQKWADVDLATSSFGQGIAVTTIQMIRAVSALANGGWLLEPQVVQSVTDGQNEHLVLPKKVRRVISESAANTISTLMEQSALHGEAKWAALKGYHIAGKTGTAQIPIAGHYDSEKTIASFVGFAPTTKAKFAMIVKLKEPKSSPWAAETAAPLWFSLAKDVMRYYNITSD